MSVSGEPPKPVLPAMSITRFNRFCRQLGGKDKCVKVVQYSSRIIEFALLRQSMKKQAGRWGMLSDLAADARRAYRLFNSLDDAERMVTLINTLTTPRPNQDNVEVYFRILASIGNVIYWTFDHGVFLAHCGFLKKNQERVSSVVSNWGWVIYIFCHITMLARRIRLSMEMEERYMRSSDPTRIIKLQKDRQSMYIDICRNLTDLVVALRGVGKSSLMFGLLPLNGAVVGSAGLASALLGMYASY